MLKRLAVPLLVLLGAGTPAADCQTLLAQGAQPSLPGAPQPSLPGAPQPTPSYPAAPRLPGGPQGGSGNYAVSAAANEHAAFLWVVDNVQHAVVLCEKADGGRDFACTKKPLP